MTTLHTIVERIEVDGQKVTLTAKADAVLLLMASGTTGAPTATGEVRTSAVDWLPTATGCERLQLTFVIERRRRRKPLPPPPFRTNTILSALARADALLTALTDGRVGTQTELAIRNGVTKARVTQLLNLHRLAPLMMEFLRGLPEKTQIYPITERKVRVLLALDHDRQLRKARTCLPGFREWTAARAARDAHGGMSDEAT